MRNRQDKNKKINRREFVNYTGTLMALGMVGSISNANYFENTRKNFSKIRIKILILILRGSLLLHIISKAVLLQSFGKLLPGLNLNQVLVR